MSDSNQESRLIHQKERVVDEGNGRELLAASAFFDLPGKCISEEVCIGDDGESITGNQSFGAKLKR